MSVQTVQTAIRKCLQFVGQIEDDADRAEIESYFVSALVVMTVSVYEVLVEGMFEKCVARCGDEHVCRYMRKVMAKKLSTPTMAKIKDVLGDFSADYKGSFKDQLVLETESAWESILTARNAFAHDMVPVQMTLRDLRDFLPKGDAVLDALRGTLGV